MRTSFERAWHRRAALYYHTRDVFRRNAFVNIVGAPTFFADRAHARRVARKLANFANRFDVRARLGRPAAEGRNARGRMAPSSGARRRGASEIFRREGTIAGAARRTSRAATRPKDCARPRRIAAATGHAFERRRSRGAPAVDARRGRGRSASFLPRTRRRTSDSRRARRPPERRARRESGARGRRRARLGRPASEGERSRANGAVFGRTASRREAIFRREGRSRCRAPNLARGDAPRRRCSAAPNRGGDGPRLRAPAVSRRAGGRRAARPAVEARRSCRERDGARAIRAELDGRRSGARRKSGARGDAALAWARPAARANARGANGAVFGRTGVEAR